MCDNLAPGADSYSVFADGADGRTKFMAVAGKTIDLGDIKPQRMGGDSFDVQAGRGAEARSLARKTSRCRGGCDSRPRVVARWQAGGGGESACLASIFHRAGQANPVAKMTAGPNGGIHAPASQDPTG